MSSVRLCLKIKNVNPVMNKENVYNVIITKYNTTEKKLQVFSKNTS